VYLCLDGRNPRHVHSLGGGSFLRHAQARFTPTSVGKTSRPRRVEGPSSPSYAVSFTTFSQIPHHDHPLWPPCLPSSMGMYSGIQCIMHVV
jgi:hypothetical protein